MPILPIYHSLGPTVCGGVSMCESGWIPFVVVHVLLQLFVCLYICLALATVPVVLFDR